MGMIPLILVTGFLDAGKTTFIQSILEDPQFLAGERVLILLCEEGEEELNREKIPHEHVTIRNVESAGDLTADRLSKWGKEADATLVILEYNGMWQLSDLFERMPSNWGIAQETMVADSETILGYNANMRQLVVDKLTTAEMVIFNRMEPDQDRMEFHKLVRGISRSAQIVYYLTDGTSEEDTIEDPLPYDINAAVIEIADEDFAFFYRDLCEEEEKYDGKTVRYKALIANNGRLPAKTFLGGRHIMTCCAEDIRYCALVCKWDDAASLPHESWAVIQGRIEIRFSRIYGSKGPVITVTSVERAIEPKQPVATFY